MAAAAMPTAEMSAELAVATEATMLCETVPQTAMNERAAMNEMSVMNKAPAVDEVVTEIKTERARNRLVGVSVIAAIVRFRRAIGQGETNADQES